MTRFWIPELRTRARFLQDSRAWILLPKDAEFLISTLPESTKKKLIFHLDRLKKTWSEKGYGRNPRVIKAIKDLNSRAIEELTEEKTNDGK